MCRRTRSSVSETRRHIQFESDVRCAAGGGSGSEREVNSCENVHVPVTMSCWPGQDGTTNKLRYTSKGGGSEKRQRVPGTLGRRFARGPPAA